jgi:hypothetical protein
MFKLGSVEKELFDNMKQNLSKNAEDLVNVKEKQALKVAQNLDKIGTLLDKNNFPVQAHVLTKYLEKKATKDQLIKSFDQSFNDRVNDNLKDQLRQLFTEASFDDKTINKMIKTSSNKFDNLFTVGKNRSYKAVGESEKPYNDKLNKQEVFQDNKYLRRLAQLTDPLEEEVEDLSFEDELEIDDD